MNKKVLIALLGLGGGLIVKSKTSKKKLNPDELKKLTKYKKYLEDNNYVILDRKSYKKKKSKLFKVSAIPTYYRIAKKLIKLL